VYSILAVIDDDQILQEVTDSLCSESRAVSTFRKADDALLQSEVRKVDLILTGQRLPISTGIELLRQVTPISPAATQYSEIPSTASATPLS
jgi:DNA-binding NtrC family response regulator